MTALRQITHKITGLAGLSPYDDLTEDHIGKEVSLFRRCINQDTTICETKDGQHFWVANDGLEKI